MSLEQHSIIELSKRDLDEMIEAAAERGAAKALKNLGLSDDQAPHDIRDLRELMSSWRSIRKEAISTSTKIITTVILTAMAIGLGVQFGIHRLLPGGGG